MQIHNAARRRSVIRFTTATIYHRWWWMYQIKKAALAVFLGAIRVLRWFRVVRSWELQRETRWADAGGSRQYRVVIYWRW